jgi:transcriptional regulator with XRE-family HTH domain
MTRSVETFAEMLTRLLAEKGLTQRALADAVGVSQSYVAQQTRGIGTFAADRIEGWADALRLKGRERERFRILALLTHCPEEIRAYVAKLETRKQGG